MFSRLLRAPTVSRVCTSAAAFNAQPRRNLNIHEYQSQQVLKEHGIRVPDFRVASTKDEAVQFAKEMGHEDYVLKAQVLAGGRGLGHFTNGFQGGVHVCTSSEEVGHIAGSMLGQRLVTKQTGEEGKPVDKVLIAERHFIRREMYFSIVLDRVTSGAMLVGSAAGGMDIETTAATNPEKIIKLPVDVRKGLKEGQAEEVAEFLGFKKAEQRAQAAAQITNMYKLFVERDCTQLEINPLVETSTGEVMCVDAKINFDDNAAYRQKEIFALRDPAQEDSREVAAAEHDLNFIGLDGSIGCLVNGAGLAMATMDMISLKGGSPANFLDVGGGASEKQVSEALKIIASDPKVKAILVNIFGGIMRCDVIALGLLNACTTLHLRIPLVVRLQGTKMDEAQQLIESSGLRIISAQDLEEAASKAVKVTEIVNMAERAKLDVSFELPL